MGNNILGYSDLIRWKLIPIHKSETLFLYEPIKSETYSSVIELNLLSSLNTRYIRENHLQVAIPVGQILQPP